MMAVAAVKIVPYPFRVVLSQYFDYEHVKFVHPRTLGEYHLIETRGNTIVYEQLWPYSLFQRRRSLVRQEFLPPNEMWFDFLAGRHKGVRVHSVLHEHPQGTRVEETYHLRLPNWAWLRARVNEALIARWTKSGRRTCA